MTKIGDLRNRAFDALVRETEKKRPITTFLNGYIIGAQDQDRIARAEEREKFFRIVCETCFYNGHCEVQCDRLREIRKAMEGGSDGTES